MKNYFKEKINNIETHMAKYQEYRSRKLLITHIKKCIRYVKINMTQHYFDMKKNPTPMRRIYLTPCQWPRGHVIHLGTPYVRVTINLLLSISEGSLRIANFWRNSFIRFVTFVRVCLLWDICHFCRFLSHPYVCVVCLCGLLWDDMLV